MRKFVQVLFLFTLLSCGKKEWSKDSLVKKCKSELGKKNEAEHVMSSENLDKICDCSAGKMMERYKSQAEADKDEAGAQQIGQECATEVLMGGDNQKRPGADSLSFPNDDDPVDTTGNQ